MSTGSNTGTADGGTPPAPATPPADQPVTPPAPAGTPPADQPAAPKTFTQAEVDAIAAREKDQGKRAAATELAEQLGVTTEEAAEIIKAHKTKQDSELSEAQKAQKAAEAATAKAAEAEAQAKRIVHDTKVERALLAAGVPVGEGHEGKLDRVRAMVTVEIGADDSAITSDVATIKELFPQLFAGTAAPGSPPAPSSDIPGTPPRPALGSDASTRGRERAKRDMAADDYPMFAEQD